MTSSEVLTDAARRAIAAAWGHVLFNQYAATETGAIAAECPAHHGLHLFEDHVIVEVVDAGNHPVPPGTFGAKVLVTTLFSRTLPLIRYELTDSLSLSTAACPAGLPFRTVAAIQGRTEDTLVLPDVAGGTVRVHPLLFHQVMDRVPAGGWQVVQEEGGLRVLLAGVAAGYDDRELTAALSRALSEQRVDLPAIWIEHMTPVPRAASGKAPLIKALRSRPNILEGAR
jgi:phenylacetate-coenzyme A ligase PaaK-like adenylate-forming protein